MIPEVKEFEGKVLVFTAPSGAGKTTIVRHLLKEIPNIAFSVSATTRKPRDYEQDGLHYHFLSQEEFFTKISNEEFIEYEEVYEGVLYGTLKNELDRLWSQEKHVVFDIDVKGAESIKAQFGDKALTIFVEPPSLEALTKRLKERNTDDEASLQSRIAKFSREMEYSKNFDAVIINDDLDIALIEAKELVIEFIS